MNTSIVGKMVRAAVALPLLLSTTLVTPPAVAGEYDGQSQCRGRLVYQSYFSTDPFLETVANRIMRLEFYYSSAERLYCAKTVHVGRAYDKPLKTGIYLYASNSPDIQGPMVNSEVGIFRKYAGPIGGRSKCMTPVGTIVWEGVGRALMGATKCLS